jgi:hypothetical protein
MVSQTRKMNFSAKVHFAHMATYSAITISFCLFELMVNDCDRVIMPFNQKLTFKIEFFEFPECHHQWRKNGTKNGLQRYRCNLCIAHLFIARMLDTTVFYCNNTITEIKKFPNRQKQVLEANPKLSLK